MKLLRKLLWAVICLCLALTWLPYFGFFNTMPQGARLPQSLALIYACNIVLTLCVFALYPLYYRPFIAALRRMPVEEEVIHD